MSAPGHEYIDSWSEHIRERREHIRERCTGQRSWPR